MAADSTKVLFDIGPNATREFEYSDSIRVIGVDGAPVDSCPDAGTLMQKVLFVALDNLKSDDRVATLSDNDSHAVSIMTSLTDNPQFEYKGRYFPIAGAVITGAVAWRTRVCEPQFMMLARDGTSIPFVSCAIAEIENGNLIGVALSERDERAHLINIPISDRNRRIIREQRVR